MLGLLQRATSNLKNPVTATAWDPSDELAAGFHRFSRTHSLPISSLATFAFAATGYYAKGTILFLRRRDQRDGTESTQHPPPAYDDDSKPRVEGEVHVAVEARTNSEGLYADSRLEPVQGHERCGISLTVRFLPPAVVSPACVPRTEPSGKRPIQTPASSSVGRIGASLSYHITVTFPDDFDSLDTISVDATSFRVLFDPSLASIQFSTLDISTTDAPIFFEQLRAKSVKFQNQNRLDPNKSSLKNFQDLISGTIASADRIEIACENGPVSGTYRSTGPIIVNNTNFSIKGDFQGGALRLSTTNAEISGTFEAKRDIVIQNAHGKIEGTYKAPLGCSIKGSYMPITASFEVGQDLRVRTQQKARSLPLPLRSASMLI